METFDIQIRNFVIFIVGLIAVQLACTVVLYVQPEFPKRREALRTFWVGPLLYVVYVLVMWKIFGHRQDHVLLRLNIAILVNAVVGSLLVRWFFSWCGIVPFAALLALLIPNRADKIKENISNNCWVCGNRRCGSPMKTWLMVCGFKLLLINAVMIGVSILISKTDDEPWYSLLKLMWR